MTRGYSQVCPMQQRCQVRSVAPPGPADQRGSPALVNPAVLLSAPGAATPLSCVLQAMKITDLH